MNNLNKRTIRDVDVFNKTVLLHLDLNVGMDDERKRIINDRKIRIALPTINYLLNHNAKIVILSHFGRIQTISDKKSGLFSLQKVVDELKYRLKNKAKNIYFINNNTGVEVVNKVKELQEKEILILENTRFCDVSDKGEYVGLELKANERLGMFWASLADVFIEDAFGIAHKQLASNFQVGRFAKASAVGFSIINETNHLDLALESPKRPYLALIGGNRVEDKIDAIEVLCQRADQVVIGGGLVYTFLYAQGYDVGYNLVEKNMIDECNAIVEKYGNKIIICFDFLCNTNFSDSKPIYRKIDEGLDGLFGLDIGKRSLKLIKREIRLARTILWNGPFGVIENIKYYSQGTTEICKAVARQADRGTYVIIGDIDTSSHAEYLGLDKHMNFISSGGDASLSYIEEGVLKGLASIDEAQNYKKIKGGMYE